MSPSTLVLALLGCAPAPTAGFSYPLDDELRFNHLQALGTHNSYHLRTEGISRPEWDFDMAPLDVQAAAQGVRQFELDLNYIADEDRFEIYHVAVLDQNTTCLAFTDCLAALKGWSDANPAHQPIFTLLEVKDALDQVDPAAYLTALERDLGSVWPRDRLVTPDDVQRGYGSLAEGLAAEGWPTLGELRGHALFVLHADPDWRGVYTDGDTDTTGRLLFPDGHGDLALTDGAVDTINDPIVDIDAITAALAAGHLVRTRTDEDSDQARALDYTMATAAFDSGAQFVSTDYPSPRQDTGYVVQIPGGTPSRCDPVTAPPDCTSEDVENPAFLNP
jgi:hypothetical protein